MLYHTAAFAAKYGSLSGCIHEDLVHLSLTLTIKNADKPTYSFLDTV